MNKKIILASSSPRRQALLKQVQLPFTVRTNEVDESVVTTNNPQERVMQLAKFKNEHIAFENNDEIILTADTVVAYQNTVFEKPQNKREAFEMISTLSGSKHDVFTGVMIRSQTNHVLFAEQTKVEFWPINQDDITAYVNTEEPYDKAGAYGIQSVGAKFVKQIFGDYYNVVGLPISKVIRKLRLFDE